MNPPRASRTGLSRREFVAKMALAAVAAGCTSPAPGRPQRSRSKMGLVTYVFSVQQKAAKSNQTLVDLNDPLLLLEECHRLGAGGMQVALGKRDPSYLHNIRKQAES